MSRRAPFFLGLLAILALGCPGQKAPITPAGKGNDAPLSFKVSKSGLGFRLSNADEEADNPPERKVAKSSPLADPEAKKILARLPAPKKDPDDEKDFAMRPKSIPAPRPGKTVTSTFPPPAEPPAPNAPAPGPLVVERHAPEGPVELAPHLTMTFTQPMVAITSVDDLAKDKPPARLVPEPPGKWRWLGTKTLMFQPDKRFPMATEYTVEVPAGTRAMNGSATAKPTTWTFTTPAPSIKMRYPESGSEPLDPIMFVEFDQAIDPQAMIGSVELGSGRSSVPIRLAGADEVDANDTVRRLSQRAEKGRWLAFRAERKLPTATAFTVRVKKGAPSAEGPRRTDGDQSYAFSTFGPMRVVDSRCSWHRGDEPCPPLTPFQIEFSNAIQMKSFDKAMISVSPDLPGQKIEVHGNYLTISGRTKGRTKYTVTVAGAIGDVHEQTMGEPAKLTWNVGSAPPTLFGAEHPMIVLDPVSPKSVAVYSINEPGLRARVYQVRPEDWEKYLTFMREWERPRRLQPPGKLVSDKVLTPKAAPDELAATAVDLGPALTNGVGQAFVMIETTRAIPKDHHRPETQIWVQSTELGLDAFVEADQVTGFATKLADGSPMGGVDVELLGASSAKTDASGLAKVPLDYNDEKSGKLLVGRKGNDTVIVPENWYGTSRFLKRATPDQARWLVYDDRGLYKPGEEFRIKGFVRKSGLGRGGDIDWLPNVGTLKVRYRVRDPRGAELGTGNADVDGHGGFDFAFKLPNNTNLGQGRVEMTLEGASVTNSTTTHWLKIEEFRRPEFEVSAASSEGPHFVGKHAVATVNASYYSGGGLPSAPVEWHVTRGAAHFTPPNRSDYHFGPELSHYWSWHGSPKDDTKTETWTAQTNASGAHRLRVDFDAVEPSYPMSLAFTAHVEDVNRQQWAGHTTMLVHPSDNYVGLKLAKNFIREGEKIDLDVVVTDIDGKSVPGRHVSVKAARLEWEQKGTEYEEKEVDVQTCELDVAADTGRCAMKTTQGGRWKVTALVTDEHGRKNQTATSLYVMGKENPKDRMLERARVTVIPDKKEYKPGELAEVLVVAPFAPAEGVLTVRRQGIVHLERFRLATTSQAFKVKLEEAYLPNVELRVDLVGQDVRVDSSGEPNPKLPKRPAYASGSSSLKILPVTRTLAVKATPKKPTLEPGGSTQIDVEVKDFEGKPAAGAEVALVVVDESLLALSSYKTPDPIAMFYSHRSPDVRDLGMRDKVQVADPDLSKLRRMEDAEGDGDFDGIPATGGRSLMKRSMAPGGGGLAPPPPPMQAAATAAPEAAKPMKVALEAKEERESTTRFADKKDSGGEVSNATTPIAMRANFDALALFSPKAMTDRDGRVTVPVKLPDNLTRYRVMAVAATSTKSFGAHESAITARLPLMVRPSAPRFLNFGDKFELPVVIQNQTETPAEVGIVVRGTNVNVDESAKRVTVAPNDRVEVRFAASTQKAGTARFQIGVASGGFADASSIELPVYTPATTEAFATYGEIDEGAIAQPVKMPPNVFPQFGGLEITTSSTQLQALTDAVIYLVKYPFECNEQLASRVMSIAALRDVLSAFKSKDLPTPQDLEASMKDDFEKLKRRQHSNGGWGFWQEQPWPYLSVHVAHAISRAKQKGYTPDANMERRALSYLQNIESYIPYWYPIDARRALIAYSLYVRKRMGNADVARAKRLMREAGGVDKLPIEAVGWIWPTISDDKASSAENETIRRHVTNRVTETAGNAHFVSGYKDGDWVLLHSDRRADGVLLEAMIGDQEKSTVIPKLVKGLLGHRKQGRWGNTNESAFVLLALDKYFATYEKITPDFVARAWLGDRYAGDHAFKGRTTEYHHIGIPMQWLATEMKNPQQDLLLQKDGPGRLYYRIGMQYAPTDLKLPPADHGFVVERQYEAIDDKNDVRRDAQGTWHVKAGAKVRARVTMVAQSRRYHVALVDPIPAGLEPMNPALAVTGEIPKDPKAGEQSGKGRYWYWQRTWYEHQNMRDERVEAFASLLWDGVWDYSYVARATTPGTFVVPPAKAEEMYSPETFGRSAGDRMIVE